MGKSKKSQKESKKNLNIVSIKTKLIFTVIPLMTLSIIIILVINFFSTKAILTENANQRLKKESSVNVKSIECWITEILSSLNVVKNTLEQVEFEDEKAVLNYLKTTCDMNASFPKGVHLADETNYWLDPSGYKPNSQYSVAIQDWYKDGLTHSEFAFGKPYFDGSVGATGGNVVSVTAPIDMGGTTQMVAAATVELEEITNNIVDIKVMDMGYCFLIDSSNNKIIAHADSSWNATTIFENDSNVLMAKVATLLNQRDYKVHTLNDGDETFFVQLEEIPYTTWVLVSLVPESSVLADLNSLELLYIFIGMLAIVISAIIIWSVIHVTIHPIKNLTTALAQITNGNFGITIEEKGKDEIAVMSGALKKFIGVMQNIIGDINHISDELKVQAELGEEVSSTLSDTAGVQSDSMISMKIILKQLIDSITDLTEYASTLANVVEHTTQSGILAKDKIKHTVDITEKGRKDMQEVQQLVGNIVETIKDLQHTVKSVGLSTKEINSIINVMGHIASETKLLSLNASIEAARAGEVGRGFAVVANGVGQLAVSSSNSADKVGEMIKKINIQIGDMIKQTEHSTLYIQNNITKIEEACKTFEMIYTNISNASSVINDMMLEMEHVDEVAVSMAVITEEQVANSQEIMQNVEVLTEHSQQVSEDSKSVAETTSVISKAALTLYDDMRKFKV